MQADLKTISAFGVHVLTAVTSIDAETPLAVHSVEPVPPAELQCQLRVLLEDPYELLDEDPPRCWPHRTDTASMTATIQKPALVTAR